MKFPLDNALRLVEAGALSQADFIGLVKANKIEEFSQEWNPLLFAESALMGDSLGRWFKYKGI